MARAESGAPNRGTPILWAIAIGLGGVALASASYGWWLQDGKPAPPSDWSGLLDWFDLPVRGVQALLLSDLYYDDGINPDAEPWLQLARIAGGLFSLVVAGRLLFKALSDSLGVRLLRFRKGHAVIFGDGPATSEFVGVAGIGKVSQIAQGLEYSPGRFAQLPGFGTLAQQAGYAGAKRARCVLVNEHDDERTWQTAVALSRHLPGQEIVAILGGYGHHSAEGRLRSISYSAGVARQIMMAHPPFLLAKAMKKGAQHILIVGFDAIGQALLREFLIACPVDDASPLSVSVVTPDAAEHERLLSVSCPGLSAAVDIQFFDGDLITAQPEMLQALRDRQATSTTFCAAYIVGEVGEKQSARADLLKGIAIQHDLFRCPIFWFSDGAAAQGGVRQGSGLLGEGLESDQERSEMLAKAAAENRICELSLTPFGSWRDALDGAGLFAPDLDHDARAFHQVYLDGVGGRPEASQSPAARPWSALDGEYRVSNRRTAAHIRAKAYAAGFDLAGWLEAPVGGHLTHELPPAGQVFDPENEALNTAMSKLEHRRWVLDRLLNGWTRGKPRNNLRKIHGMLCPYDELEETEKKKDAAVVEVTRSILLAARP